MHPTQSLEGHGGDLAVAVAQAHGVQTMFTLSGAHVFPMYDGAVRATPSMRLLDVRHEPTAVFAAEATGKLTRTPGLAVLTAGPGVTNGVSAIAQAHFAGSPLVVIGGRAPTTRWGMGSLQELDHPPLVAPITKLAATVPTVDRVAGMVDDAFSTRGRVAPRAGVSRRSDGRVILSYDARGSVGQQDSRPRSRPRGVARDRRDTAGRPASGPGPRHRRLGGRRGGCGAAVRRGDGHPGGHQRYGAWPGAAGPPEPGDEGPLDRLRSVRPGGGGWYAAGLPARLRRLRRRRTARARWSTSRTPPVSWPRMPR